MAKPLRYLGQAIFYILFMSVIGYFSTYPVYTHLPPDQALVKLSFVHTAQRKGACRERTDEELAKLAPNMRVRKVCPRERSDVVVELDVDGKPLYHVVLPPSGVTRDGSSAVYRRFQLPAGRHRFTARLKDWESAEFNYTGAADVTLAPGRVMVIDFKAGAGGFLFKS